MNFLVFSALCVGLASAAGVGLHGYGGVIQQQPQLINVPSISYGAAVPPSRSYSYFYRGQPQVQVQSAPVVYQQPQQQVIQTVPVQHIPTTQRLVHLPQQQQVIYGHGGYTAGHNVHYLPQNLGSSLQLSSGTILGGSTLSTSPYILGHK